jgi:hypothetical protein
MIGMIKMENKLHSFERPKHFELEKKLWELTGKNVSFSGGYFEMENGNVKSVTNSRIAT